MSLYTVYGFSASTYVRTIQMAFSEKGVSYDLVPVDILKGETQSSEHLNRHPFGKIPAFEFDNTALYETASILEVIEGHHPEPALFPLDVTERARMRQWISVIDNYFYAIAIRQLVWHRLIKPILNETPEEQTVVDALPKLHYQFGLFDQQLNSADYLAGKNLSAADLYLAPIMGYIAQTPEYEGLISKAPNLNRWWQSIQTRESYSVTNPE